MANFSQVKKETHSVHRLRPLKMLSGVSKMAPKKSVFVFLSGNSQTVTGSVIECTSVHSEVNPTEFSGTFSQVNVPWTPILYNSYQLH